MSGQRGSRLQPLQRGVIPSQNGPGIRTSPADVESGPIRGRHTMLQALGYAGFGSSDLDDWRQFGTGLIGLQNGMLAPKWSVIR